ncbi:MAG: TonB-dependent receptor [Gemmatimonadetes bacterium]|nr:TonB-dependent receptor [Gemmatimonadota bacterium]
MAPRAFTSRIPFAPVRAALLGALLLAAPALRAQDTTAIRPDSTRATANAHALQAIKVVERADATRVAPLQQLTLPATASITAQRAEQVVNLVDPEDAVKYLPSVFLRKRNYGDTQATMATRVWGVSSSARSLVFADGVPLTALIANNNTIGGPRWGLVSTEEIARIDLMYGPFSAAYAGNSMGAVMEITTRQPDSLEGSVSQTQALQRFDLYGTRRSLGTSQTSATIGDRAGRFSFWASGDHQDSHSQPLLYVTSPNFPAGTTGGYTEQNKLGAPANVLGATGLLHTGMTNATFKLAYDVTAILRAAYTFGYWQNDATAGTESYLSQSSGQPTFAGQAGFASGDYDLQQRHFANSLSLRTDNTRGDWDAEAIATRYRFDRDQQRTPTASSATDTSFGSAGRIAVLDGTGWSTLDLKAAWHRGGLGARHIVSFGAHDDRYALQNPTYNTPDWRGGDFTSVSTEGDGKTRTQALWAQDSWRLDPALQLTIGGRWERWHAYDGYNASGGTAVSQPEVTATRFSPKAILAWSATPDLTLTASLAKAYRFATASELYQLVSTGATFTSPDPNLKPDDVLASELRVARRFERGVAQLALFQDDVHDAIIAQFLPLVAGSPTLYSYLSNVDHVRARGVELMLGGSDVLVSRLDLSASATYLDARTLALSGRASATAPAGSAVGKLLPNIPRWRATAQGSYRPVERLALSLTGRYSGKMFTTLDNADVHPNTYQGFEEWFVMDARAHYQIDRRWSASLGVDNLLDRKYFLFHPFPQRTLVASAKLSL